MSTISAREAPGSQHQRRAIAEAERRIVGLRPEAERGQSFRCADHRAAPGD